MSAGFRFILGQGGSFRAAEVEPQSEHEEREERTDGIQQRIVRRSGTAGDEGLVNFIEARIARSDKPRRKSPGPPPSRTRATNAAKNEEIEDEVFAEVRGFANQMMDKIHGFLTPTWEQPMQERTDNVEGVRRGKRVGGQRENDASPGNSGPPGTDPLRNQKFVKLRLQFR